MFKRNKIRNRYKSRFYHNSWCLSYEFLSPGTRSRAKVLTFRTFWYFWYFSPQVLELITFMRYKKCHHFAIWMTFKHYYCCNIELTHVLFGQIFKFKCPTFTSIDPELGGRLGLNSGYPRVSDFSKVFCR